MLVLVIDFKDFFNKNLIFLEIRRKFRKFNNCFSNKT
ncbi:hypothetical protein Echvi_2053 [Echinicola vietnamensis DSM 17526]|uniref:Uncharacterized protein n=1 Tax=Echinicola vietnamensis (strain DSM 17526 / LMG 23754 / KMM 6221) TaxID=926556 RepID=L0G0A5_ECHVK|nr:hypothetical protein Echvi_2053 [Echinicola vietnamensis DSM 17526]